MPEQEISHSIQDMIIDERPRERLERYGASELTTGELLAILLRVGAKGINAVQLGWVLLKRFGGLNGLHQASFEEICAEHGMGKAKAAQIKAAIELGHRLDLEKKFTKNVIKDPKSVFDLMGHSLGVESQEQLWVLALSTRNEILREQLLYIGTLNHSSVRLAEVFEIPIRCRAASIIVVHNHPSGNPAPSNEDIRFTEELINAGNMMDIGVLDHIIIARDGFTSIRASGQLAFNTPKPKFWH